MKIRKATINDSEEILKLLYQIHKIHSNNRQDIFKKNSVKYNKEELLRILNSEKYHIYVYEDENKKVLAHLFFILEEIFESNSLENRKILFIDDLCVDEFYRGKGIGKELIEFAIKKAKEFSCDSINLNVWNFKINSLEFYKKLGFNELKTLMEIKLDEREKK